MGGGRMKANTLTKELREYAIERVHPEYLSIADRIDAEHERRLASCRRETLRRAMRYIRRMATYYEKGTKMVPRKEQS